MPRARVRRGGTLNHPPPTYGTIDQARAYIARVSSRSAARAPSSPPRLYLIAAPGQDRIAGWDKFLGAVGGRFPGAVFVIYDELFGAGSGRGGADVEARVPVIAAEADGAVVMTRKWINNFGEGEPGNGEVRYLIGYAAKVEADALAELGVPVLLLTPNGRRDVDRRSPARRRAHAGMGPDRTGHARARRGPHAPHHHDQLPGLGHHPAAPAPPQARHRGPPGRPPRQRKGITPMTRALAVGEFLCPGCGGVANMIIQEQEQPHAPFAADPADQSPIPTWWAPWQAWATVELICQGPGYDPGFEGYDEDAAAAAVAELPPGHTAAEALAAVMNATYRPGENDTDNDDDDESDSAWDHAGTSIDLVATRYQPISLN